MNKISDYGKWIVIAAAALALQFPFASYASEKITSYRVGITSFRDKSITLNEWQATMDYLSSNVPHSRFIVVPLNFPEFKQALDAKQLDFVITNPEHYIYMETKYGVSRVATLTKSSRGRLFNQFGGVIFTAVNRSDINSLADITNKKIAAVDRTSFAGFLLQYDLLHDSGLDLNKQTRLSFLGFPQDLCVYAVLKGELDVGFVRTGILESMAQEGKLDIDKIKVINQAEKSDFPFLISTKLYPEWPFAVLPHVSYDITNQVAAALLLMPPEHPAAKAARYHRWVTPLEYQSVQTLMRKHHVSPFDQVDELSLNDVFTQYGWQLIIGLGLMFGGMAALYLRARALNRALQKSRENLSYLAHHDPLTGLSNRVIIEHDVEKAIMTTKRTGEKFALAMIDLDGFKPVNDKYGHLAGDDVLKEVAKRLRSCFRANDSIARWGGDEFILLFSFSTQSQLEYILEKMLDCAKIAVGPNGETHVSGSIGVSIIEGDTSDVGQLTRSADEAMYSAKRNGKGCFVISRGLPPTESM